MADKPDFKKIISEKARDGIKDFITEYWVIVGGEGKDLPSDETLNNYAEQLMKNQKISDRDVQFDLNNFQAQAQKAGITDLGNLGKVEDLKNIVPTEEEIKKLANAADTGYKKSTENWFSFENIGNFFSALMSYIGDFFEWMFSRGEKPFPGDFVSYIYAAGAPSVANNIAIEVNALDTINPTIRQKVIDGVHHVTDHMANNHGQTPKDEKRPEVKPLKKEQLQEQYVKNIVSSEIEKAFETKDSSGKTPKDLLRKGQSTKTPTFGFLPSREIDYGGFNDMQISAIMKTTTLVMIDAAMDSGLPHEKIAAKTYIQQKLKEGLGELAKKEGWTFTSAAETISTQIAERLDDKNIDKLMAANQIFNKNGGGQKSLKDLLDNNKDGFLNLEELGDKDRNKIIDTTELSALSARMNDQQKKQFDELLAKEENKQAITKNGAEVTEIDFSKLPPAAVGKTQGLQLG